MLMPAALEAVEIAPHLIPAGLVAVARQRRARPVVEAADEERLAVLDEARPLDGEAAGQRGRGRQRRPADVCAHDGSSIPPVDGGALQTFVASAVQHARVCRTRMSGGSSACAAAGSRHARAS
jgi:hypothetical protein